MKRSTQLTFKVATEAAEIDQLHRLNYKTFVEEIPQHNPNPSRILIDRFDPENTYIICLRDKRLVGMVAVRGKRPFSLDQKLPDLDLYLPVGRSICEIRLLAVEREFRNGLVFRGLAKSLFRHCQKQGHDFAVVTGALSRQRLYKALGFVPFGPIVGKGQARFQPMYLSLEDFEIHGQRLLVGSRAASRPSKNTILLPGPVAIRPSVREAFIQEPVSHRSQRFMRDVRSTKQLLCDLVGSRRVEIMVGTGTLANDVIAGQLSLRGEQGLVLTNGEFGDRLIDHARRLRLRFDVYECAWGKPFEWQEILRRLDRSPDIGWIWAVHCETSTGMLNDLGTLKEISTERGLLLCVDCISSIATVPVDLSGIHLASGVSGKGLGAFPGLSMVFYNHDIPLARTTLPRYLDLGLYAAEDGVPFTASSNLLYALRAALMEFEGQNRFQWIGDLSRWLRTRLTKLGFDILTPDDQASPAVITIPLPRYNNSEEIGEELEGLGYTLSYKSRYLLERNWLQICLMGDCARDELIGLLNALQRFRSAIPLIQSRSRQPHLTGLSR